MLICGVRSVVAKATTAAMVPMPMLLKHSSLSHTWNRAIEYCLSSITWQM